MRTPSQFEVISGTIFTHRTNLKAKFKVGEIDNKKPVILKVGKSEKPYAEIEKVTNTGLIISRYIIDKKFYNIILFSDLLKI